MSSGPAGHPTAAPWSAGLRRGRDRYSPGAAQRCRIVGRTGPAPGGSGSVYSSWRARARSAGLCLCGSQRRRAAAPLCWSGAAGPCERAAPSLRYRVWGNTRHRRANGAESPVAGSQRVTNERQTNVKQNVARTSAKPSEQHYSIRYMSKVKPIQILQPIQ